MTRRSERVPGRVSVITIFFNEQRFLREAIESVLLQTYPDWELLLVDDGSTDGSTTVAQDYAGRHRERIRYIEHEGHRNCGMSASRNLGLRFASGEYVAFLDADDVWLPPKLEQQVNLLQLHGRAAMVYGRTELWHSWTGEPHDQDQRLQLGVTPNTLLEPPSLLLVLLRNEDQLPAPSDVLFRHSVLDEVNGFDSTFTGMFEDIVVLTKVSAERPVFVADQQWIRYRQHRGSCVARAEAEGAVPRARLRLLTWMERYFSECGMNDRTVWRALRRELRPYRYPRIDSILRAAQRLGWRAQGAGWWLAGQLLPAAVYHRVRRLRREAR